MQSEPLKSMSVLGPEVGSVVAHDANKIHEVKAITLCIERDCIGIFFASTASGAAVNCVRINWI
jgi:hypothetical protein